MLYSTRPAGQQGHQARLSRAAVTFNTLRLQQAGAACLLACRPAMRLQTHPLDIRLEMPNELARRAGHRFGSIRRQIQPLPDLISARLKAER